MRPQAASDKSGPPGWLLGVLAAVIVVLVGGAAVAAYYMFFRPVPNPAAASAGPPITAPSPLPGAQAGSTVAATAPGQASTSTTPPVGAPSATVTGAQQTGMVTPPVDPTLKVAADLVQEGEHSFAEGDYDDAIHHARSALDVHAGFPPAVQLLQRAQNAQQRIVEERRQRARQRAAEQQRQAEQLAAEQQAQAEAAAAAAARAAAAAAEAAKPTPDEVYNQRAHSECTRGLFGKSCRHKIRVAVCQGVEPGARGSTVCADLKD